MTWFKTIEQRDPNRTICTWKIDFSSSYVFDSELVVPNRTVTQIAKFIGPTWGPPGSCRPQMGPMLASWTLLSGNQRHPYGVYGGNWRAADLPIWQTMSDGGWARNPIVTTLWDSRGLRGWPGKGVNFLQLTVRMIYYTGYPS